MKTILKLLRRRRLLVLLTIGFSIVTIVITLWWSSEISIIINTIGTDTGMGSRQLKLAVLIILLSSGGQYLLSYVSGWTCETIIHDLRMGYAEHFLHMNICEVENLNVGMQMSELQNEIAEVSEYLNGNMFILVNNCIRFVATFSWLMYMNPKLAFLSNLPVVLIMIYVSFSSRVIGNLTERSQESKMEMNGMADTLLRLFPVIQIYNASVLMKSKYNSKVKEWEMLTVRQEKICARLMSLSGLLSFIPLMLLMLIGGMMIIEGKTTLGALYVFINLSGNVSGIMMNMPGYMASFRRFSANMKRIEKNIWLDDGRM